jgi:hypothetical protein
MSVQLRLIVFGVMLAVLVTGCFPPGGKIIGTLSTGIDHIPAKLGLYPFLSTPIQTYGRRYDRIIRHKESLSVRRSMPDNVVIVPPAETDLSITRESQIMTGLISMQLATRGFSLKELPVEVLPQGNDPRTKKEDNRFVISLNLLEQLREEYDLQALIVGNAFFITEVGRGLPPEQRVISAHLKVVDIATLDVLGQVNLTYDSYGVDMNAVSEYLAEELAVMAGLGGGEGDE